jgi:hypothetical protein
VSALWIIAGILCLLPLAWLGLVLLASLAFWLLASNAIEYLIIPAILALAVGGGWMLLHGAHVL